MRLQQSPRPAAVGTGGEGWAGLFAGAFGASRNPMALLDASRRHVDINGAYLKLLGYDRERIIGHPVYEFVAGGPMVTPDEWARMLGERRFAGQAGLISHDGTVVAIQWGATVEVVTGSRLILLAALNTSRSGPRFRRTIPDEPTSSLSARQVEIVRLVAQGATGPEIADELHISHDTVRTHVRNAMTRLGARSRAHLVARALGEGHVLT